MWYLVRFGYPDGRPVQGGGRWIGVIVSDTDPLNALIQARSLNRDLYPFRELLVLDVVGPASARQQSDTVSDAVTGWTGPRMKTPEK